MLKKLISALKGAVIMVLSFAASLLLDSRASSSGDLHALYSNAAGVARIIFACALFYTGYAIVMLVVHMVKKRAHTALHGKSDELRDIVRNRFLVADPASLREKIQVFVQEQNMNKAAVTRALKEAVPLIVEDALNGAVFTSEKEKELEDLLAEYTLSIDDLDEKEQLVFFRGVLIRDLLVGEANPRLDPSSINYTFMEGEVPIWAYTNMPVAKIGTSARDERDLQSLAIPVGKGRYWTTDTIAARERLTRKLRELGKGVVLVTSHNLYYQVGNAGKCISLNKIANIVPYSNAVVVYTDEENASPLVLKNDSWFLANILQNTRNWAGGNSQCSESEVH